MSTLKELLLDAPETQLDKAALDDIRTWNEPPKALEILKTLDMCVHSALASGFAIQVLELMLDVQMKEEGTTHEELGKEAFWRERIDG